MKSKIDTERGPTPEIKILNGCDLSYRIKVLGLLDFLRLDIRVDKHGNCWAKIGVKSDRGSK